MLMTTRINAASGNLLETTSQQLNLFVVAETSYLTHDVLFD